MKTYKFYTPLLLLFLFCASCQAIEPDQVIEIFRHGARAPTSDYDPQWTSSELGQLTTTGMVEQYNLGKTIAQKYPNLVASGYNPRDVYVLANYVERCIESAMVQLSSIFRGTTSTITESLPKGMQASLIAEYDSQLPASESSRGSYVPVRVDVVSTKEEKLIFNGKDGGFCKKMSKYINENQDSSAMSQAWTTFQTPINQANTQLTGSQKIRSMSGLNTAYDAFVADQFDNKPLPGGITDTKLVDSLGYGASTYIYIREQSQLIQRQLSSFNTLEAVLTQMANFRAGINPKKLVLYSGHDKNLLAVLAAFGIVSEECLSADYQDHLNDAALTYPNCLYPAFASNLIFEFYNDATNPYVKFYYNGNLVSLCNGQDSCSYQDFKVFANKAGGNNTPDSWDKKCGNKLNLTWIIVGSVLGGLVIISSIAAWIYFKKRAARRLKIAEKAAKIEEKLPPPEVSI